MIHAMSVYIKQKYKTQLILRRYLVYSKSNYIPNPDKILQFPNLIPRSHLVQFLPPLSPVKKTSANRFTNAK